MDEKIIELLAEACGVDAGDLEEDIDLFAEGLLDSFGMIAFIVSLEDKLGIKIEPTEIERDDIRTPALIKSYLAKKG